MALNVCLLDIRKRRRPPARVVIFVNDHCAHALVEIMLMNDA
jgi:hypothetical protein